MVKKISAFFAAALICASVGVSAAANDIFTPAETALSEFDTLTAQCNEKGLSADRQKANAEIARKFIEYGRYDLKKSNPDRAEYMRQKVETLVQTAVNETESILRLEKGMTIPRYDGGKITVDKENFKLSDGTKMFFGGYLIFSGEMDRMSDFKKFGNDYFTFEIGPASTMVKEDTFLPSWETTLAENMSITADENVFKDGKRSVKLSSSAAPTDGSYSELKQIISVKPNKKYRVSMWLKGENARGNFVYLNGDSGKKTLPTLTYDWKKVLYTVDSGDAARITLRFVCQNKTDALWIDSISVTEDSSDLNIIDNGDFETEWSENGFLVNNGAMNYIKSVLNEAKNNGLAVSVLLSPHYIPDWFFTKYPEAYGYQEGFLKGNVINETYKKFVGTHAKAVAEAVSEYTNIHSLILTNEAIYNTIYYTYGKQTFKDDFISWLREKYNCPNSEYVPDEMRTNWGSYAPAKWANVSMPAANAISANGRFWDWMEYNNHIFGDFHKFLADKVHEADSDIKVTTKLYDNSFSHDKLDYGTDVEDFYSLLDYNGFDGGMSYASSREGYLHIRMAEDLANSISDKPTVNSENHILPDDCTDYSDKHALVAGADLWQGFIHGRTASAAWVWRRHDTYAEYRNSIAYRPDLIANMSNKLMNANLYSDEIEKLQNQERHFYILYSRAALLYDQHSYMSACNNAYETLWSVGQRASFITERQIAAGKLPNDAVLIIPSVKNIEGCAAENIAAFGGRTVIIGNAPAKNEYNRAILLEFADAVTVADDIAEIRTAYEDCMGNIPYITVRDENGALVDMTDIRAAADGNGVIVNMCSNTWDTKQNLSVYYGKNKLGGGYDILNGAEVENTFDLTPFEPMLLKFSDDAAIVPTKSADIGSWTRVDSLNKDNMVYDTVNPVSDETYGSAIEVIKQSDRINDSRLGIRQDIPADKLVDGHNYVLEFKFKMEDVGVQYWIQAGFSSWESKYLTQPWSGHNAGMGWKNGSMKVTYSASTFKNGLPVWIFTANAQARFKIADVRVYDEADENKTNLVVNGSFEEGLESKINFGYSDGMCRIDILSKKKAYPIMAAIAVYDSENRLSDIKVYKYDIMASDETQSFEIPVSLPGKGYSEYAYLWNGETLEPLTDKTEIK